MDIIDFFRSIDGILYYLILVVNTILIFAIIGYLGEKNNQKLIKMGLNTPAPANNGSMDFSTTVTQKHNDIAMPTVSATAISNDNNLNVAVPNQNINNYIDPNQVNNQLPNNNQNISNQINGAVPNNNVVGNPNVNSQQPMPMGVNQPQINNEIDPNEKAPAVLVINSQNTDMPK